MHVMILIKLPALCVYKLDLFLPEAIKSLHCKSIMEENNTRGNSSTVGSITTF